MLERIYYYLDKKMLSRRLNRVERAELNDLQRQVARMPERLETAKRIGFKRGLIIGISISAYALVIAAIALAALPR